MNLINNKLHISTITAVSKLNCDIDLQNLYDKIEINDTIKFIQYGNDNYKGYCNKLSKKKRKKKNNISFYNCCSIHFDEEMEIYIKCPKNYDNKNNIKIINGNRIELPKNLKPSEKFKIKIKKIINVKIFKNGRIQITGLKYENQGIQIIHKLIDLLNKNSIVNNDIQLKMIDYSIVLINCDFELSHGIDRYKLHDKLTSNKHIPSSFVKATSQPAIGMSGIISLCAISHIIFIS